MFGVCLAPRYSTFTGYINRMRGYYGLDPGSSFYFWGPKKYQVSRCGPW